MNSDFINKFEQQAITEESKDKPFKLVAVTGLQIENFVKVAIRGALTSQSIAITKTDRNYDSFGELAIILKAKEIFNGERKVSERNAESVVATGDYFSVRTPELHVEIDSKEMRKHLGRLLESKYDSETYSQFERLRGAVSFDRLYRVFERSSDMKRMFLDDLGLDYVTAYKRKALPEHSITKYALEHMSGAKFAKILRGALENDESSLLEYRGIIEAKVADKYLSPSPELKALVDYKEGRREKELERLLAEGGLASARVEERHITSYRRKDMIEDSAKNAKRFLTSFKKAGGRQAYQLWVSREMNSLVKGYHSVTPEGKKLAGWDAVDRYMKRSRGEGKEEPACYTVGELRSTMTRKLNSLHEVIEESHLISTNKDETESAELATALGSFKGLFWELCDLPSHDWSIDVDIDRQNINSMLGNTLDSSLEKVMKKGNIESTEENVDKMKQAIANLKSAYNNDHMRVPYFECVEHRPIPLSSDSIESIVVGKEYKDFVEGVLKDNGIKGVKVKTYNTAVDGAMFRGMSDEADITKHSNKLDREHKKTLRHSTKMHA